MSTAGVPTAINAGWAVPVPVGFRVGPWEVTEPIATGNFGSVYAARRCSSDPTDGPPEAALKFLATAGIGPRRSRELRELAQREVDFSRTASHERLIKVFHTLVVPDTAESPLDGTLVLVMERATHSLQDLIDCATERAPLPGAALLIEQICEGLAYLHGAGWVHGDLKPSNILIMADGSTRLADFGLVARLDGTHGYAPPLGSTDYLPPERWQDRLDERGVPIRPSADIWALGVTSYQILTGGSMPIPGSTPGARAAGVQEFAAGRAPLRLQSDLDGGWRTFVTLCLAPDHTTRAAIGIDDLLARARQLSGSQRPIRRKASRRLRYGLGAAALLTVAASGTGWWWHTASTDRGDKTVRLKVYNAETACRDDPSRNYNCSLGLALDPRKGYQAGNVSRRRVWHGDVLQASCVIYDGTRVADEYGVGATRWYRVAVPEEPSGYAWLPGVRTRDEPTGLPTCPR